jgi:hypothetical protein
MNKKIHRPRILLTCLLAAIVWGMTASISFAQTKTNIGFIVLPFENNSTFEGPWDIGTEVPRYIAAYLGARYGVPFISPVVVMNRAAQDGRGAGQMKDASFWDSLRTEFGLRFLITGSVQDFDISRFTTGTQLLGGYESFKGELQAAYTLYDLDRLPGSLADAERSSGEPSGEYTDRSFALTLLGKPTERTVEYRELGRIKFGSEEFNATVIGQACKQFAQNFCLQLESDIPLLRSRDLLLSDTVALEPAADDSSKILFRGRIVRGTIVFVEGDDAFVSVGVFDGVQKGQTVTVYADPSGMTQTNPTEKIGTIELTEIRGPHLSLGKIRSGKSFLKARQQIRVRVLE